MALHCQECGFVNAEAANYCQKCGAFLGRGDSSEDPTTISYRVGEETSEQETVPVKGGGGGPVLAIRAGGGRAGDTFKLEGERLSIGRTPEAEVFLDDVTVSRNHALIVQRRDGAYIDDLGSLNGTYVNRHRIESHRLDDGDEIQIGKFKLTYLER